MDDLISRQAAIDAPEKLIKDCNPDHFVGHQKFIEFMDNAEIGSFGNWQFANGFNLGLTAAEVATKNLPSAQRTGQWIKADTHNYLLFKNDRIYKCSNCGRLLDFEGVNGGRGDANFCPNCGCAMEGGEE